MAKQILLLFTILALSLESYGQLIATPSTNADSLAQSLVGEGVVVSNAQLICANGASGFFDGNNSNLTIKTGVILSSGFVVDAQGPNNIPNTSGTMNTPGNPLLNAISGGTSFDCCELRFDVVPLAETMRFRYIFASEEYAEFVNSAFNDAFGFFISGPNPIGGQYIDRNIAIIPNTTQGVSIATVNNGFAAAGTAPTGPCTNCSYYTHNEPGSTVEYDAFTTKLQASVDVVKCSTYTLRLMVGDVGDRIYDSAVMIEEGSLASGGFTVDAQTTLGTSYTNMIEGCLHGELVFKRTGGNSSTQTIYITVAGTATNCIDYTCIPDSIIIPANQNTFTLPITAFQDSIVEGFESIKVYISLPCSAGFIDSTLIYINDSLEINVQPQDSLICPGTAIRLIATGGGNFQWTPSESLDVPFIANPWATPKVTTTYTVTGSLASCTAMNTVTVYVDTAPTIFAGKDTTICRGNILTIPATGNAHSYTWSPGTYMPLTTILNPVVGPIQSITYTLTAYDSTLTCPAMDTFRVNVQPIPIIRGGPDRTICRGDSVQLNGSGGTTYVWTPATGLSDPNIADPWASPVQTTIYTLTGTDSIGCSRSTPVRVTVLQPEPIQSGPDTIVCPGQPVQLHASGVLNYTWWPNTSLSNDSVSNPIASPILTTTYTVSGTGTNGCNSIDSVTITVHQPPLLVLSSSSTQVCTGDTVQLQASGGISYSWQPALLVSNPSIANPFAIINASTTFIVTASDAIGCTATDSITVNIFSPPAPTTGGRDSICLGETAQLNASGGTTYLWAPAASLTNPNIPNPVASPLATTTYTLVVQDANGCSSTDQITITVLPLPAAYAGPDRTVCEGAPTNLLASGGSQYLWTPSLGLSCTNCPSPNLIPTASTVYSVEVSDQYGCMATSSVSITVIPLMSTTISANPSGVCPGGTVQLGITGGANWQWSPAASLANANSANPIAIPPTTMWYYVNSTDVTGCVKTDSILVTVFDLANLSAGNDTALCIGQNIGLQAVGANTYSWSPATGLSNPFIANPVASPAITTTYTLTGIDANNCSKDTTIIITVNPLPMADAGPDHTVCQGTVVQLSGSGGTGYQWSPSTGLSCTGCPAPQLVALSSGSYILRVTDANGCVDFDTTDITILPAPALQVSNDTTICTGSDVQLSASGAVTYQWLPANTLSNPAIANPLSTPSGPITYTVTGTGANNCTAVDSITVDLHPVVPVVAGPGGNICGNDTFRLQASNAQTYEWAPAALVDDPTLANPLATPGTTTTFTVTGRDLNTCPTFDFVTVTVHPTPNIALNVTDTTICPDVSLQLMAFGALSYTWTPATGLSNAAIANPVASPSAPVVYTVVATDPTSGCVDSATVTIDIYPYSNPNAQPPVADICPGDVVQLLAENGIAYRWEPASGLDNPNIAGPVASPNNSRVYTVTITDINGCEFSDEVDITVHPAAIADAGPHKTVQSGHIIALDGFGNGSMLWTPALWLNDPTVATPTTRPDSSITYYLTVTTAEGCTAIDSVFVDVFFPTKVIVPNAFSPNGDGQNDVFRPNSLHEFEMELFQVFDRWGQIIFSTTDPNGYWDGTIGGQPAQMGVYVFTISGRGNQGEPIFVQGNVTLLR